MTVITSGSIAAIDFRTLSISRWYNLTLTTRDPTYAVGDERAYGNPAYRVEFFGNSFSYDAAGVPNGGSVNAFQETSNGQLVYRADGISQPVTQLLAWSRFGQTELALSTSLAGNDVIYGSPFSDYVRGYGGGDTFVMGTGNDTVFGGAGNDVIDGGSGTDTVWLAGRASDYRIVTAGGVTGAIPTTSAALAAEGVDKFIGVETLAFSSSFETRQIGVPNFAPLNYIASYADLMAIFGANASAGFDHYLYQGAYEGRTVTFSGNEYLASYNDLVAVFGTNSASATAHYISNGRTEGRTVTFDGLEYIATYADLIRVFGSDADAGAAHFLQSGRAEGRSATFDGLAYLASYDDLSNRLLHNSDAGSDHFIRSGRAEGRHQSFDPEQYVASYSDLITTFGLNSDGASLHWIERGRFEGRVRDAFDADRYLANYADLRAVFGADAHAATEHYIKTGYAEGRTDHPLL